MVCCSQCGAEFSTDKDQVACISGSIMGDESTDCYYFCRKCGVYTVEICHDRFLNEEEVSTHGPIPKEEGDLKVALIARCSEPWDKKCRCDAHRSYFGDALD